jgi:hypothetical protein
MPANALVSIICSVHAGFISAVTGQFFTQAPTWVMQLLPYWAAALNSRLFSNYQRA